MITQRRSLLLAVLASLLLASCASLRQSPPDPTAANNEDDIASVNFKLGVGYMQSGRFDLAQSKLRKALEYEPRMAEAHNALGVLYEESNNRPLAERHYQLAVESKPEYVLARMNYGRLLCATGKALEGEQQFLQVTNDSAYATLEIPYTGAGVCARARNDLATAEGYFRQALESNPYAAGTLLEMASLQYEQRQFAQAREFLQRYHRQAGYSRGSLTLAIEIEDALGDNTQLRDEYNRLLQEQS